MYTSVQSCEEQLNLSFVRPVLVSSSFMSVNSSVGARPPPPTMDGSSKLLMLCFVMLVGSYLAGSIPLFMNLNEDRLQLVSVFGAGLLVGTALSVIIPEGMQTLNMAYQTTGHAHGSHDAEGHKEHEENPVPHLIGVSLVLGFIFMLVIDQVASSRSSASKDTEAGRAGGKPPVSWTATLGLVVHAAADGVALGAAATTNQTDVEMIVFLAIMLHKAPASFGLVTYLLHEGLDRSRVRKHLGVFSLAAPATAILTFLLLTIGGHIDTLSATGVAMLFSAGTFLYVATVHVLPEVTSVGHGHAHGGGGGEGKGGFSKSELSMLVLGTIMPLFLTMGHHH